MIQVTAIPDLNPYHRLSPTADFTTCPTCEQTYQPGIRLAICPHPIISPRHLFPADTRLVVRTWKRPKKRRPLILQEPYYFLQDGEDPLRHEGFRIYLLGGLGYTLAAVAEKWRKHYSFVRKVAKEDKWEVRRQAYFREQEVLQHIETQRILKRDTADMLKVVRARLRMLAVEASTRLKLIEAGKGERMTETEFDNAMDKAVKLYRLLQEQSTENIKHDTPEMQRERQLRDAVSLIQEMVDAKRKAGATEEEIVFWQNRFSEMGAARFDFPAEELSAALVGAAEASELVS